MIPAKFAATGSAGALASSIGWIDFGPNFSLIPNAAPVTVSNSLPNGYTVSFQISAIHNVGGFANFDAAIPPIYSQSAFGQTGYVGIAEQAGERGRFGLAATGSRTCA